MKAVSKGAICALLAALMIILTAGPGRLASAQPGGASSTLSGAGSQAKPGSKVKRIIILGTTIMGSVTAPRVVYEVPWKEPDSFRSGLDEPRRSFYNEIFSPAEVEPLEPETGVPH